MLRSLLVAPIYAASCLTGGGQRTFHICRSLARLGTVDMVLVSEDVCADLEAGLHAVRSEFAEAGSIVVQRSTPQFLAAPGSHAGFAGRRLYDARRVYRALRPRSHFYRPSADAVAALTRTIEANRYDVVVGRYLQCTALSGAFQQRLAPVVVDLDDLDEMVLESRIDSPTTSVARKRVLRYHAWQVRRLARRLRARCRHVFTASETDRLFVAHPSCSILPNIPFCQDDSGGSVASPTARGEAVVLFVGSHGHRVNREGLLHFVAHCWPSVHERVPAAQLRVVGSGGWEWEREGIEKTEGVKVVGTVRELQGEYASAALCVVPLFEGSGTKIKVIEALKYGRAVVASSHSARGYESLVGNGVVSANTDGEMIEECVHLLENPARCEVLSAAGHRLVEANYSFESVYRSVRSGLVSAGVMLE